MGTKEEDIGLRVVLIPMSEMNGGNKNKVDWLRNMGSSYDEDAIRALYQQKIDGWNAGNGSEFAAPYTDVSFLWIFTYQIGTRSKFYENRTLFWSSSIRKTGADIQAKVEFERR